jgi:phosphate transport system protein
MRDTFHKELESLDQDVVHMGALVQQATQMVTSALIRGDSELADQVKAGDREIDALFVDIELRALSVLAQQAPVAGDLRLIVAILRVVNDLERAGDLAYNIATMVEADDFSQPGLKNVKSTVSRLGNAAARLMGQAIDAWAAKDEALCAEIGVYDDEIDDLHSLLLKKLVDMKGDNALGLAIRLALVGRYFERIGDHAVNMGEGARYFLTGDKEHLS